MIKKLVVVFALVFLAKCSASVVCYGQRTFSQALTDGCTDLVGYGANLVIDSSSSTCCDGSPLVNIDGDIILDTSANIEVLSGLENVVSVGGSIKFFQNCNIKELKGFLPKLRSVFYGIYATPCQSNSFNVMDSIDGFYSLQSIPSGDLQLYVRNSITGFHNLEFVHPLKKIEISVTNRGPGSICGFRRLYQSITDFTRRDPQSIRLNKVGPVEAMECSYGFSQLAYLQTDVYSPDANSYFSYWGSMRCNRIISCEGEPVVITIGEDGINTNNVVLRPGDAVTFLNVDNQPHSVEWVGPTPAIDVQSQNMGDAFIFTTEGTYNFVVDGGATVQNKRAGKGKGKDNNNNDNGMTPEPAATCSSDPFSGSITVSASGARTSFRAPGAGRVNHAFEGAMMMAAARQEAFMTLEEQSVVLDEESAQPVKGDSVQPVAKEEHSVQPEDRKQEVVMRPASTIKHNMRESQREEVKKSGSVVQIVQENYSVARSIFDGVMSLSVAILAGVAVFAVWKRQSLF